MQRQVVEPPEVAPPSGQYSHGVVAEGVSRTLYVAGQVALDENGELVGPGDPVSSLAAPEFLVEIEAIVPLS